MKDDDDEDMDETLALGADRLLDSGGVLPAGIIAIAPVADANKAEPTGGVVRSLQFHPNGQLLLTAGLDKRLRLFQVRPDLRLQLVAAKAAACRESTGPRDSMQCTLVWCIAFSTLCVCNQLLFVHVAQHLRSGNQKCIICIVS